jgi:hypothetical protein
MKIQLGSDSLRIVKALGGSFPEFAASPGRGAVEIGGHRSFMSADVPTDMREPKFNTAIR